MSTDISNGRYHLVPVHEDDLGRVFGLLAEREKERAGAAAGQVPDPPPGPRIYLDSNVVIQMYQDSEERHRKLMEILAEAEGRWLYTAELADALGVETGSKGMAGTLGAFGRRAKHRYKGLKPWESSWEPVRDEARYRMDPEVAAWVRSAAQNGDG